MAIQMVPKKLREVWGEEVIEALLPWLEEFIKEKAPTREEHREIISRLDTIEIRLGNLEKRMDGLEKRMDRLDTDVKDFRKEMNERFDKINERFDTLYTLMASSIKWTVGTLALFGTMITVLLAISQFVK